jgi:hypothetical protein
VTSRTLTPGSCTIASLTEPSRVRMQQFEDIEIGIDMDLGDTLGE